jgi:hypothetical protein
MKTYLGFNPNTTILAKPKDRFTLIKARIV